MKCSACVNCYYCSKECQMKHWKTHKLECNFMKEKLKDSPTLQRLTGEEIEKKLRNLGFKELISNCLIVGIKRGFVSLEGENPLKNVVFSGECYYCGQKLTALVKDCAEQADEGWEDGGVLDCTKCQHSNYVTRICTGNMKFECGKYHHHCRFCPNNGGCIGDNRVIHCMECGNHFFERGFESTCPNPNCSEKPNQFWWN
jgi:hypothetical protein